MSDKRISQLVERVSIANNDVLPIVALNASTTNKVTISTIQDWMQTHLDHGVTSIGITIGSTGTDISVSGSPVTAAGNITINVPTSSAANRGLLSAADWTTFNNKVGTARSISTTAPLEGGGDLSANRTLSITQSGASSNGYLSSTDWNTFNNKEGALTKGNLTETVSGVLTITGGTSAVIGTGTSIEVKQASSTQDGFLDSGDWSTFNNKQAALGGTGIVKSTGGIISYLTDSTSNWDAAYNDKINSAAVTGTTTKTLTLTQQDGGTITATWTDDNTDAVSSVFGRTGAVIAVNGDYNTSQVTENTNLYYTDARARAAITLTTTGTTGAATYNSSTGFLNIPNYAPDLSGYVPYIGATGNVNLGTHSLTAYDLIINHSSGSGVAASITKAGSGEALTVTKSSGSGNAASITGGVTLLETLHLTNALTDTYIASSANWNAAYNDKINSAAVTGTTTKTLTLTQQDGGTITASWTDINTDAVSSVFGRTGAVVAVSGDYDTDKVTEGTTNLYFTNARSRSSISLTTTGTSGAATYDNATGVLNIPSYVGGVTSVNTKTGAVVLKTSDIAEETNLYYTDARARAAITLTTTGTSGAATYSAGVLNIPQYSFSETDTLATVVARGATTTATISVGNSSTGATGVNIRRGRLSFSNSYEPNHSIYNNYLNIDSEGIWDGIKINSYLGVKIRTGDAASGTPTTIFSLDSTGVAITGNLTATNLSGTNTGDQTLSGLGGVPTSRTLTINGTAYDLSANRSWTISTGGLSAGFTTYGTLYPRTGMTTYSGHSTSAADDAPIKSLSNTEDNWIYCDSGNATWGIYHRNIDSTLSVASQKDLPANSIAFVGASNLNAYISLQTGEIWSRSLSVGITETTGTVTASPSLIQMDSTFGNNAAGKNFKLKLFQQGNSSTFDYGLGISSSNFELTAGSGASFNFYINAATPTRIFNLGGSSSTFYVNTTVTKSVSNSDWLSVWDNTATEGHKMYFGYGNSAGTRYGLYITGTRTSDFHLAVENKFYVQGNGFVGINTTGANSMLTIKDGDIRLNRIHTQAGGETWKQYIIFTDEVDRLGARIVGERTAWDGAPMGIGFDTGGVGSVTRRLSITSSGQILVNTDTLSAALSGATLTIRASSSNVGQTAISIQDYNKVGRWAINGQTGASVYDFTIYNAPTGAGDWTPRFTITEAGNVGVGITPQVKFHVDGRSYIGKMNDYSPAVHIRGGYYGGPRLQVYGLDADSGGWMGLGTDMSGAPFELSIYYPTNSASSVCFGKYSYTTGAQYSGFTATARLSNNGTWTVASDVIAYGSPSDISLKENIKPIKDALEKVLQLEGVSFDWKADTDSNSLTGIKEDLGFIAQQVQGVIPKLVRQNDNGKLSLRDKGIVPYLVEAIKEQQKQINELKKQKA
jgi:hypothetical protein